MNTDQWAELRQRIAALATEAPLAPWKLVARYAVGGLSMVGYAPGSDLLLVVSPTGRGVFDGISGLRLARDHESRGGLWGTRSPLWARGFGTLEAQELPMAGIYGGGLLKLTLDGWHLQCISPVWPDYRVILSPPSGGLHLDPAACVQVEDEEPVAFGFSGTGQSFVVALSHTLSLFAREPSAFSSETGVITQGTGG